MRFKVKPLVAGAVAGGVLAVGGIAAIDAGTQSAEAQPGSIQAQLNEIRQQQTIIQRQNIRAIKQVNTYSEVQSYWLPPGQLIAVNSPKVNQTRGKGGGLPASSLSEGTQSNFAKWVKIYYNGAQLMWEGNGVTGVSRTGTGDYRVTWNMDISQCNYQASIAYYKNMGQPDKYAVTQVYYVPGQNNQADIKTWKADTATGATPAADYPVQAQVVCSAPTINQSGAISAS